MIVVLLCSHVMQVAKNTYLFVYICIDIANKTIYKCVHVHAPVWYLILHLLLLGLKYGPLTVSKLQCDSKAGQRKPYSHTLGSYLKYRYNVYIWSPRVRSPHQRVSCEAGLVGPHDVIKEHASAGPKELRLTNFGGGGAWLGVQVPKYEAHGPNHTYSF